MPGRRDDKLRSAAYASHFSSPRPDTRMKSFPEQVAEAKQRIREVSAEDVQLMLARGEPVAVVDVREPNEWAAGHVLGATLIPRGVLEFDVEAAVPRDAPVVVYCAVGGRSALAADTLQQMGYTNVASMRGGIQAWADAGGEIAG